MVMGLSAAALLAGCSSRGAPVADMPDKYVITQAEIHRAQVSSAYDVIMRLRPEWLYTRRGGPRGAGGPETVPVTPVVYLNGSRTENIFYLQTLQADHVVEIRFVIAREATTKYGTGHPLGAIEVVTR